MRCTTVNTDAGVKEGKGAVAYWIRSDNKWLTGSRPLKTPNLTCGEAELIGMVVGLDQVANDAFLSSADVIVVNCDSTDALYRIKNDKYIPLNVRPILDRIYEKIPKKKIRFKWVKGHKKKDGESKHWVNNWCDQEVRKHY